MVLDALGRSALFIAAALPLKGVPSPFQSLRRWSGVCRADFRIRSNLSATLFLADPDSYDGGELVVEDVYGEHWMKARRPHGALPGVEPL